MQCEVVQANSVLVVTPKEARLDFRVSNDFRSLLMREIDRGFRCLVINMEQVDSIDSAGLGAFISVVRRLGRDGDIRMCSLRPHVREVFEVTRLHRVVQIAERKPSIRVHEQIDGVGSKVA